MVAPVASRTVPETCEVETAWDHAVTQATQAAMADNLPHLTPQNADFDIQEPQCTVVVAGQGNVACGKTNTGFPGGQESNRIGGVKQDW